MWLQQHQMSRISSPVLVGGHVLLGHLEPAGLECLPRVSVRSAELVAAS